MTWDDPLSGKQIPAARHREGHARLLAGPGTGKTRVLTQRVVYLVTEADVPPQDIIALTFTRAAASELRNRVRDALVDQDEIPFVSTLHAFALRNLLYNSGRLPVLPIPLRIADDWEERWIIQEDLKREMDVGVKEVRKQLKAMAADFSTLSHETETADADPRFIGAWRDHRQTFGYTLRDEMVFRLKRALDQIDRFQIVPDADFLLVDEFQDLNRCDLGVMEALGQRGVHVYGAGDDDQSIYGFRHAAPDGIRNYGDYFDPFTDLDLDTCHRCDRTIIEVGEFVADQDPDRLEREVRPREDASEGNVHLLRFRDQWGEAEGIRHICEYLVATNDGLEYGDILILLRLDRNQVFSDPIAQTLSEADIPVSVNSGPDLPVDTDVGREMLSGLRLALNPDDSIAWRTILKVRNDNQIGDGSISKLYAFANARGTRFGPAVRVYVDADNQNSYLKRHLPSEIMAVDEIIGKIQNAVRVEWEDGENAADDIETTEEFQRKLGETLEEVFSERPVQERDEAIGFLLTLADDDEATSVKELLVAWGAYGAAAEQETDPDAVNILTMHKAKGLTAPAVIVASAEDEAIPGRNEERPGREDERRLLYVSLTRAKSHLYITYCDSRTGTQRFRGRTNPRVPQARTLTRFLQEATVVRPQSGQEYLRNL